MPVEATVAGGAETPWSEIRPYIAERLALALDRIPAATWQGAAELRLRAGREARLVGVGGLDLAVAAVVTTLDLEHCLEHLTVHSRYAWEEELAQGYLTIPGGHRVGIAGNWSAPGATGRAVRSVSALNYRIARAITGPAADLAPRVTQGGLPLPTLLVGPPGCGKTTLLRDLVRAASDGLYGWRGQQVSLVDERSEIAASHAGLPGHDVGARTDVLDGLPKSIGMRMALRALGPQVLATDEIGGEEDALAVLDCAYAGVTVLASVHASSLADLHRRPSIARLMREGVFPRQVLLGSRPRPGTVLRVADEAGQVLGAGPR